MKIHGDRGKTDSFLYLLKRFDWVWRHKFTLVLFCVGATTFAAGVARALARAAVTMAKVDLWHARLAVKTLRRDQREAIAEAADD